MTKQIHCSVGKSSLREAFDIQTNKQKNISDLTFEVFMPNKDEQWQKLLIQKVNLENLS